MADRLELNAADRNTALYGKLQDYWRSRIDKLRIKNDGNLDERETTNVRAQIACYATMLKVFEERPPDD